MKIHACLLGEWVCLNEDPDCKIGSNLQSPDMWYEENARIWSSNHKEEHTYYQLDYVELIYKGRSHRINPAFIQVTDF